MSNVADEPWSDADLLFLTSRLRHGATAEEVAGFLGRGYNEVLEKAKELNIPLERDWSPLRQEARIIDKSWK
jgi:hypothetical protein